MQVKDVVTSPKRKRYQLTKKNNEFCLAVYGKISKWSSKCLLNWHPDERHWEWNSCAIILVGNQIPKINFGFLVARYYFFLPILKLDKGALK